MNRVCIGNKVTNMGSKEIIGKIVFIGKTQNIPKELLAQVEWYTAKERKPFWIIIELDENKDYDCLDSMASFNRIYKIKKEVRNEVRISRG
jgi:hypothetical protein